MLMETIAFATLLASQKPVTKMEGLFSNSGINCGRQFFETTDISHVYTSVAGRQGSFVAPVLNSGWVYDQQDSLVSQITDYGEVLKARSAADGRPYDLAQIQKMIGAIKMIPSGIPTPNPMLSDSGELGLYWDTESAFADLVLEASGRFSLFIRQKDGASKETFLEDIDLTESVFESLAEPLGLLCDA